MAQIEGLAARQPVLMVFEDVHWSDPTTREALDLLIERMPALRVLVIVTFRPEFTPPWIGRPQVTLLSLNRLPPAQRAEMITHVTGGKALPKEIADQIIDRTDGVPLFIEELTKTVVESGVRRATTGERYAVTGPAAPLAIPTTLHGSLLARLDRLAPTREVAQIGAALGRQFSHELISAVAQMPQQQVDDALAQLVRAELIFRRGDAAGRGVHFQTCAGAGCRLQHLAAQSAPADSCAGSRRLWKTVSEIVAAQPAADSATLCGGRSRREGGWLLAQGGPAVNRALGDDGSGAQLRKGLKLIAAIADSHSQLQYELDLQMSLGPALLATKGFAASEVGDTFARARALAEQLDRPEYQVPLLYGLGCTIRSDQSLSSVFPSPLRSRRLARRAPIVRCNCLVCGVAERSTSIWAISWLREHSSSSAMKCAIRKFALYMLLSRRKSSTP